MDTKATKSSIYRPNDSDFETPSLNEEYGTGSGAQLPLSSNIFFIAAGVLFGILLVKSEVISWFRIQEMFRFQSFHMYGILGSAVAVAAASVWLLRRSGVRALTGDAIELRPKTLGRGTRYWVGGTLFGIGWALTGACPGPLFALIGAG